MAVRVTKPALNVREKLTELDLPKGKHGTQVLKSNSLKETCELVGSGRRNLLINGGFDVWQRGTTFTTPSAPYCAADRWNIYRASSSITTTTRQSFTLGQQEVPGNPKYFMRVDNTPDADGTWIEIVQNIEDVTQFSDKWVTLSFWMRANKPQENNQDNSSNALGFFNKVKDSMSIENFQFDVNKLKFFGIENDTILLDTSLNINKYYQFNYRKKDNFEFLKFNNIGQVYNKLSYSPNNNFLPKIGFSANKMLLIGQEDYKFYDVAYPLTELFFKTVYSQGQLTDALFTTNINKNTNFLLAFKALRSLGKYQNSLSGSKHFRFGFSFIKNNLDSKIFFSSQKLEKHENGGLNDTSLIDFESGDPEFKERSKLNVNFEDAVNTYQTRNFYFKNNYTLLNKNKNYISIIYNLDYETTNNKYEQEQASYLYGSLISGLSEVNDHYKFRSLKNVIAVSYTHLTLPTKRIV